MSNKNLRARRYPSSTTRIVHPQSSHFVTDYIFDYVAKGKSGGGAYFLDGHRKVHYVLVLTRPQAYYHRTLINLVITKLEDYGLDIEQDLGITIPVVFIKIHISEEVAKQYLDTYDIQPEFLTDFDYTDPNPDQFTLFKTPLQNKNVFHELETESLTQNKLRIIICMLDKVQYGPEEDMQGIDKLKNRGIFLDHYPLHDGPIQIEYWHNDDLINDRTLLAKYWSSFSCWYKGKPLDLIHKYYGAEIAFCNAWSEAYDYAMLLPVAIVGTIVFIINYVRTNNYTPVDLAELCEAEEWLCKFCHQVYGCRPVKLKAYCNQFKNIRYFENMINISFSNFVIIWALIFNKYWQRKEYYLRRRWNLLEVSLQEEIEVRLGYKEKAKRIVEGNKVNFEIDRNRKMLRILCAIILYMLSIGVILLFLFGKQTLMVGIETLIKHFTEYDASVWLSGLGYTLQATFTMTFSKCVVAIGAILTDLIVPKTQGNYDRLILFLTFTLDINNNYLPLIHTGFGKNTHRYVDKDSPWPFFHKDYCDPSPCLLDLYMQYAVLLTLKTFIEKICVILIPKIKKTIKTYMKEKLKKDDMPQYEEEYKLASTSTYMVNMFLSKKVIQLGLILAFVYSFPLAPLCALIHNILSSRIEATSLVFNTRRPALKKGVYGVGVWNRIVFYLIIVGGVMNIILICFLSDVLDRLLVEYNHSDLTYSMYIIFSVFQPQRNFINITNENYCLFRGEQYPPHHVYKYELSKFGIHIMFSKCIVILAFEVVMSAIFISLDALIPTVPLIVKKNCFIDRTNLDNAFNKKFNKQIDLLFTDTHTPGSALDSKKSTLHIIDHQEDSDEESEEEDSEDEEPVDFEDDESEDEEKDAKKALAEEYSDEFDLDNPFTVDKS